MSPLRKRRSAKCPKTISAHDINILLLSHSTAYWQKVAKVIGNALRKCDERRVRVSTKAIDTRMTLLVRDGRLEAQGNLKRWGYSEVRLPPAIQSGAFSDNP